MKRIFILLTTLCPLAFAQPAPVSIVQQLCSFSPMAHIYLKHLGLTDRNGNGVIDQGAGEGYEAFTEKYGNADIGFYANRVMCGADNGMLEENEIINHYYINIRFKPDFQQETAGIEDDVKTYIYANNIPLVWLDDENGTVMNAVTRILGEGWNDPNVERPEDETVQMFRRALQGLRIAGRTGDPSGNNGYYTLPEMVNRKSGYCVEAAQFGFWFFSQLKINSVSADAALSSSLEHEVIKLNSERIVDYFGSSNRYSIPRDDWHIRNPLQALGRQYRVKGEVTASRTMLEQAVLYDKYEIDTVGRLMNFCYNSSSQYYANTIIELGEFFLQNNDIDKVLNSRHLRSSFIRQQVKVILLMLFGSYSSTNNKPEYDRISTVLQKYYAKDAEVKKHLNYYRL